MWDVPRLSVFIACSLDGFIASSDNSLNWLEDAADPEEDYGFEAFMTSVDAVAMGRGTYDFIADVEPWPFGDKPVFVFTHRPPRDPVMHGSAGTDYQGWISWTEIVRKEVED